jgi:NAD(P)-dependent dehydrogenase (short-subunit alcohol dehydrogenase family)
MARTIHGQQAHCPHHRGQQGDRPRDRAPAGRGRCHRHHRLARCRARRGSRRRSRGTGLAATSVQLDVTDETSIAEAAAAIEASHGRLDILVNNAGIFDFADAAPSSASIPAVRKVLETNFIGALAVS